MKTKIALLVFSLLAFSPLSEGRDHEPRKENLYFSENKGQLADQDGRSRDDIAYYGHSEGLSYYFKSNGISYQLYQQDASGRLRVSRVDMTWLGCKTGVTPGATHKGMLKEHYYTTGSPHGITGVHSYGDLTYSDLYPGVDLHYYYKGSSLKYDFIVAPGGDYKKIRIKVDGATTLTQQKDGSITITTPDGTFSEGTPVAFQAGKEVEMKWVLEGNILSFEVKSYNSDLPLIIDPVVFHWNKQIGSASGITQAWAVFYKGAVDAYDNVYAAVNTTFEGSQQSIYKYNSAGNLIWTSDLAPYLYNNYNEEMRGISLFDSLIFVTGNTTRTTLATTGAYQQVFNGTVDAYVAKFDTSGAKLYVTYYGGSGWEIAENCAMDASGNIYICGRTESTSNMASSGAYQTALGGGRDAFIAKFDVNGFRVWGTYFGGAAEDYAKGIAVRDSLIFVSGTTKSATNIASAGAFQNSLSGTNNGFLACFDTSGTRMWSTYYGADSTLGTGCTVNGNDVYFCGTTNALTNIATPGVYQPIKAGLCDGFLVKFSLQGARQWGTYYGGAGQETVNATATVSGGNIYICGRTNSAAGIATPGSYNPNLAPTGAGTPFDAYVAYMAEIDTGGQRVYGTYYNAGMNPEQCVSNSNGTIVLSGYRPFGYGDYAGFLAKFSYCNTAAPTITTTADTICSNATATLSAPVLAGVTYQWYRNDVAITGAASNTYVASLTGDYKVVLNQCPTGISNIISLVVLAAPTTQTGHTNVPCYGAPVGTATVTVSGGTAPYSYTWDNLTATTPGVTDLAAGIYIAHTSDANSCVVTDTITVGQDTVIAPSNPLASLCTVTVDSATGKNLVVWEKTGDVKATGYNIYRETSVGGQYELMATIPVSQLSTYLDNSSLPLQQSYSYKLAEIDSCDHEWRLSSLHKTIHLSSNVGINGEINLSWNVYEGKTYGTHYIERSFNGGPFALLNEVSSSITSYSDLTPPVGDKIYRIAIDLPVACDPSRPTAIQRTVSNVAAFVTTGIGTPGGKELTQIVPNPTQGLVRFAGAQPYEVRMYDITGRMLLSAQPKTELHIGGFAKGVYLLRLINKAGECYYTGRVTLQ